MLITVFIFSAVLLTPGGVTTLVCVSESVQFTCNTTGAAIWTTRGFLDGDTNVDLANGQAASLQSPRIETPDMNPINRVSVITISNFSYGDQNATVVCLNGQDATQRAETRIVVG